MLGRCPRAALIQDCISPLAGCSHLRVALGALPEDAGNTRVGVESSGSVRLAADEAGVDGRLALRVGQTTVLVSAPAVEGKGMVRQV